MLIEASAKNTEQKAESLLHVLSGCDVEAQKFNFKIVVDVTGEDITVAVTPLKDLPTSDDKEEEKEEYVEVAMETTFI